MASLPQAQGLPILYRDLVPLSSLDHASFSLKPMASLQIVRGVHAVLPHGSIE